MYDQVTGSKFWSAIDAIIRAFLTDFCSFIKASPAQQREIEQETCYTGVILQSDLKFNKHIQSKIGNAKNSWA